MPDAQQKVNCRVQAMANGGRRLVFTLEGSNKCVGEICVQGDLRYLLAMSQMFVQWVNMEAGRVIAAPASQEQKVASAVRHLLNGHAANQG